MNFQRQVAVFLKSRTKNHQFPASFYQFNTSSPSLLSSRSISINQAILNKSNVEDLDKPIQFTTSQASKIRAEQIFGPGGRSRDEYEERPVFHVPVVIGSIAAFLIYFCILREENDIDEEMSKSIWERVPGLEQQQLYFLLDYNKKNNMPVDEIIKRIKELELKEGKLPQDKKKLI